MTCNYLKLSTFHRFIKEYFPGEIGQSNLDIKLPGKRKNNRLLTFGIKSFPIYFVQYTTQVKSDYFRKKSPLFTFFNAKSGFLHSRYLIKSQKESEKMTNCKNNNNACQNHGQVMIMPIWASPIRGSLQLLILVCCGTKGLAQSEK